jgi:hypothetical protein
MARTRSTVSNSGLGKRNSHAYAASDEKGVFQTQSISGEKE